MSPTLCLLNLAALAILAATTPEGYVHTVALLTCGFWSAVCLRVFVKSGETDRSELRGSGGAGTTARENLPMPKAVEPGSDRSERDGSESGASGQENSQVPKSSSSSPDKEG